MKIIKIVGIVLVLGAIASFAAFYFLGGKGETNNISKVGLNPPPLYEDPNVLPEPGSVPANPVEKTSPTPSSLETEKNPPAAPPPPVSPSPSPGSVTQLPKCQYREFIIEILSNTNARPASLTLYNGDTITFVNQDDALHWPGADPHPTHSEYPNFDATGGIVKGQTFSVTFKKLGKFGWHEHIIEKDTPTLGYITVLPCQ